MRSGEAPAFWWTRGSLAGLALSPLGWIYGAVAARRLARGFRASVEVPVLCVGNFTVGGGGKTPTVLALGQAARAAGLRPGFLSRGFGGSTAGPLLVDPSRHGADEVGDEPLLLAAQAPTVVAVNRKAGADRLMREGNCDFVIMDDGFQSARLRPDYALLVVDGGRGLGNGRVVPAGPLRAPLSAQVRRADALLVIGRGSAGDEAIRMTARGNKPVFEARLQPVNADALDGVRVLAFAGIADPEKFYRTLRDAGVAIAAARSYPDHHPFSDDEIIELLLAAEMEGLVPVTTRKDAVRFDRNSAVAGSLLERVTVLDVALVFEPDTLSARIVRETLDAFERRRFG